jgi:hypothetical protein
MPNKPTIIAVSLRLSFIALLLSCQPGNKNIGFNKTLSILWDISYAEAYDANYSAAKPQAERDSLLAIKYAQVFAMHRVPPRDFFYTLDMYRKAPKEYLRLMDSLNIYGERKRQAHYEFISAERQKRKDTTSTDEKNIPQRP